MPDPVSLASSPRRIRQANEVAALSALHRFGPMSRADLARRLKLNRSSSGHIIAGLTTSGLVREVNANMPSRGSALQSGQPRAGRPGIMLELAPEAGTFLGIEVGVEHLSFVELDLAGNVVASTIEAYDCSAVTREDAFARAVTLAIETLPSEKWARCEGVGVSLPAQMGRSGFVRLAPLLGWRDFYPADLIRPLLPAAVPIWVENDANAFAIGATYARETARRGVTLFLVMETGVGGGITVDGALFRGGNGLAGEIGHLRMAGDGRDLEQLIGLEALLSRYRHVTGKITALSQFLADVQDRVPEAVTVAEGWSKALAFGITQACRLIDPEQIVLGGSVAALYPLVSARVAAHLAACQDSSFPLPTIVLNEGASLGSAFGAACMMHQRYLSLDSRRFADEGAQDETSASGHRSSRASGTNGASAGAGG